MLLCSLSFMKNEYFQHEECSEIKNCGDVLRQIFFCACCVFDKRGSMIVFHIFMILSSQDYLLAEHKCLQLYYLQRLFVCAALASYYTGKGISYSFF